MTAKTRCKASKKRSQHRTGAKSRSTFAGTKKTGHVGVPMDKIPTLI